MSLSLSCSPNMRHKHMKWAAFWQFKIWGVSCQCHIHNGFSDLLDCKSHYKDNCKNEHTERQKYHQHRCIVGVKVVTNEAAAEWYTFTIIIIVLAAELENDSQRETTYQEEVAQECYVVVIFSLRFRNKFLPFPAKIQASIIGWPAESANHRPSFCPKMAGIHFSISDKRLLQLKKIHY